MTEVPRRAFLTGGLLAASAPAVLAAAEPAAPPAPITRKIKIGLIGCGGRGSWLGGLFQAHGGYEFHATADYFQESTDRAGDALGVDKARRFSGLNGYQKLLASGVEAVIIVNIPRFHADHAAAAIAAGCHVYAAKPVAIDVPRALQVLAAGRRATETKLVHLVDYQMPTDPINAEVLRRVQAGGLGRLMHVDSHGFSGVWDDPADRSPENLLRRGHWLTTTGLSGDSIVEYSVHTIDAVLLAVGKRPVRATGLSRRCRPNAQGESREVYLVTYEFDDGLVWTHRCQALGNKADNIIRCDLFGDNANAQINYWGRSFLRGGPQHYGGGDVVSLYDQGAKRNIAAFYENIRTGRCDNPTVRQAVDDALTGVLGREACLRGGWLTLDDLLKENRELPFDTSRLKA